MFAYIWSLLYKQCDFAFLALKLLWKVGSDWDLIMLLLTFENFIENVCYLVCSLIDILLIFIFVKHNKGAYHILFITESLIAMWGALTVAKWYSSINEILIISRDNITIVYVHSVRLFHHSSRKD